MLQKGFTPAVAGCEALRFFFNTLSRQPHTLFHEPVSSDSNRGSIRSVWQTFRIARSHFPRRAIDCSVTQVPGQRFMNESRRISRNPRMHRPARQSVRSAGWIAVFAVVAVLISPIGAVAQLYDALDAYPPRWQLDTSDCNALVIEQKHLADGGVGGGGCETITLTANLGSEAILAYRIEPVRPIDDLTAKVSLMGIERGLRIGFRVRFPYQRDRETRRPESVIVFGAGYTSPGEFATIGVGKIERDLRLKTMSLRHELGSQADLRDPYVDAVVVNAYTGAGKTTLRLDELSVTGMVSMGEAGMIPQRPSEARHDDLRSRLPGDQQQFRVSAESDLVSPDRLSSRIGSMDDIGEPFPSGRVIRILQHNGEPLSWVRTLGFDAVLLSRPPDAAILREANLAQVTIYAPPPTAPDPNLEPLLDPVAAWFVGMGTGLDSARIDQATTTTGRVRAFPSRWQRPIIAAPAESWPDYAALVDAIVDDLPLRQRGLSADEEVLDRVRKRLGVGDRVQMAVAVASMPPARSMLQTQAIADSIGAIPSGMLRWHSMWLQTIRSLEGAPAAILFRSTQSLVSGGELSNQRSMALSYINRMVAMIAPWVAVAQKTDPIRVAGAPYRCARLTCDGAEFLLVTSLAARGNEVLAGDGQTIEIQLPPDLRARTAWRLTHFSAERIDVVATSVGASIQIVSPDAAEIIVISDDATLGSKLAYSSRRFARQAATDRWQLTNEALRQAQQHWNQALSVGATSDVMPVDLITAAGNTLGEAEPMYRAGDTESALRMARRADAWTMRVNWQLSEALMPSWPNPTSCPPLDSGLVGVQIAWAPLMQDEGWGIDRLASGGLDSESVLGPGGWSFGKRKMERSVTGAAFTHRGRFDGAGALRLFASSSLDDELPGGYEGTVAQLRSPPVRVPKGKAYRIDAMVRTIGFGGPHQGLLVYESVGGQEMGVLVRGREEWTPVRLYRQADDESPVRVMFELLGSGEAFVDEVTVRLWEPEPPPPLPLMPLQAQSEAETSNF